MSEKHPLVIQYMNGGASYPEACRLAGVPCDAIEHDDSTLNMQQQPYDEALASGVDEALAALRRIMDSGKSDAAIVSAANAILDRAKGKPVQTTQVNKSVAYTIVSAIPAPPNSLTTIEADKITCDDED